MHRGSSAREAVVISPRRNRKLLAVSCLLALWAGGALAQGPPCEVPDNGSGTITLPPAGCGYLSPSDVHEIINGLPAGTTIQIGAQHQDFFNISEVPGGSLGGFQETFQSSLFLDLQGTGSLSGFHRTALMQAGCETHTAPRTPGQPVQSFDTDMFRIQGQLPPGDPDFDLLRITAGTAFGMPSPGHTTLTRMPNGNFNVDSFFDITYRIDFIGHPGGPLGGMSGSTTGTIRMKTGRPAPCTIADDGSGTVHLPPEGCGYVSPADLHRMINGLPAGTTIEIGAEHSRFFNSTEMPGGTLGGMVEMFQSGLSLHMNGTGSLQGFHKTAEMPAQCETHTAPRQPGDPVQSFDALMFRIQGQLPPGDPDFDLLRITAGNGFGMPSPGHTTLTRLPSGDWNVDSFFDISYRIDFVGRPGGPLGGMSGSTTGTIRMATGDQAVVDVETVPGAVPKTQLLISRPNPFNPSTTIPFVLDTAGNVEIVVYDTSGRMVRRLVNEAFEVGQHETTWDGHDDRDHLVGSGSYYIELRVDGRLADRKKTTLLQ